MFVHTLSSRRAGTASGEDRGWIAAVAVFLAAVALALVVFGDGTPVHDAGDPLTLPEATRPMIMVPMHL